jgi:hypothetical protein
VPVGSLRRSVLVVIVVGSIASLNVTVTGAAVLTIVDPAAGLIPVIEGTTWKTTSTQ